MPTSSRLDEILARAERLGVIGSPSSTTELSLDILGVAASRKLVGEFALFEYDQDAQSHYALGQITGVQLRNVWHEDPTMRSLIRQRGRVDAVSARQDTHLAQMAISAVFAARGGSLYEPSILGTVPSTGTGIQIVSDEVLDELLTAYRDQIFYLGNIYGSKPMLPLWFKHFGQGPQGAGEAYHLGIFGKTGSGKSVLAKMLLTAYARHASMAILVIDPQGEFSRDFRSARAKGSFALPLRQIVQSHGRPQPLVHTVRGLILDRWELFEEILYESEFFEHLTIRRSEQRELACDLVSDQLQNTKVTLTKLSERATFDKVIAILSTDEHQQYFYKSPSSRARFTAALNRTDKNLLYERHWKPITELFRADRPNSISIDAVLRTLFENPTQRPIVVLDLSREEAGELHWNDHVQALVIKRVLVGLERHAEDAYRDDDSLNALVVIDEAHRLAPKGSSSNLGELSEIRDKLVDAARTTRKYGLGWLFISQTLSSIDPEIIQQLRIMFFGFGLSMGQEYQTLRELAGSSTTALDLYRLFRDPHSSFDTERRQYSFMTIGPVSPLSFASTPLFFNAFNSVGDFLAANHIGTSMHSDALVQSGTMSLPRATQRSLTDGRITMNQRMLLLGDQFEGDGSTAY